MAEVRNGYTNGMPDAAAHTKVKRRGFWSSIFSRSSSNVPRTNENKDGQEPKRNGFMNSLVNNARQAAAKEVVHLAEDEAMKQVKAQLNSNNNGSQLTNTTTGNTAPDASTTTTPSDAFNASTNWAKRMVDSAQQKMQNMQNLAS